MTLTATLATDAGRAGYGRHNVSDPKAQAKPATIKVSARAAAVLIGDTLGRPVTAKQVRTVARDTMPEYQDEAYTAHAYSRADVLMLLDAFQSRTTRRGASIAGSGPQGQLLGADVAASLDLSADDLSGANKGTATK
jgi:hypothetical protein